MQVPISGAGSSAAGDKAVSAAPAVQVLPGGAVALAHSIFLLPITSGVAGILGAALRALERPHLILWGYLASKMMALIVGGPITLHFEVAGAELALVLDDLPAIAVIALCLSRWGDAQAIPA